MILDKRTAYMPFEYKWTETFVEGVHSTFWTWREANIDGDVNDFKVDLTDHERTVVGNILKTFAQTEVNVQNDFWASVFRFIPKPEIAEMCLTFAENEARHAKAYSKLNVKLGLDNFHEFLEDELAMARFENLAKIDPKDWTINEQEVLELKVKTLLRGIAIFSCFTENVSLFSQFAILLSFKKFKNKLTAIRNIIKWSAKDEHLHASAGIALFNTIAKEYPQFFTDQVIGEIVTAAKATHEIEIKLLDQIFEDGELDFISKEGLIHFMKERINKSLEKIGLEYRFEYDQEKAAELDWFNVMVFADSHDDFFATRPDEYAKKNRSYGEDELF